MGAIFFETIMHDEIAQLDGWAGSQKVDNFQENQRGIDALPAKAKWKFFSIPCLAAAQNGVTKFLEFLAARQKNHNLKLFSKCRYYVVMVFWNILRRSLSKNLKCKSW